MILRRWNGLDNSFHPSADAPPDTTTVQENADDFIDGAHFQRLGTKQIDAIWTGAFAGAGKIETGLRQATAFPVRTLAPVSRVAKTGYPLAAED